MNATMEQSDLPPVSRTAIINTLDRWAPFWRKQVGMPEKT